MGRKRLQLDRAVDTPRRAAPPYDAGREEWRRCLEIIGAELFQRYRKRLTLPGVAREIRRDYPGLSLPDVLVRVHAGRRLIEHGDDFRALAAIRSGDWQRHLDSQAARCRREPARRVDRISRWLVKAGGALFGGFCLLSLVPAVSSGALILGPLLLAVTAGAGLLRWRRLRRGPRGRAAGGIGGGHDPMPSV
jgi:hypothetical protein